MRQKPKLAVLTGAGMSADSGIKTFRDADGLWEGHDVMEVASIVGWNKNPELVLEFYNQRRRQLKSVSPNQGHIALKELEDYFDMSIITQNVDNLHERAESSKIIHLHGELNKIRSTGNERYVLEQYEDIQLGDKCPEGYQLRPDIVWFGEEVPMMQKAILEVSSSDALLIIGTSLVVYPAAGLIEYIPHEAPIVVVDPKASSLPVRKAYIINETAAIGTSLAAQYLIQEFKLT